MSKNVGAVDNQSSSERRTNLLQALNAAAGSLQRSARSREAVFRAFEAQTAILGWDGAIMLLDESGQSLTIAALAYPSTSLRLLKQLGKIFNKDAVGFSFPIEPSTSFHQVIASKRPLFIASNSESIRQVIPDYARPYIDSLVGILGNRPSIFAPIFSGEIVHGLISIAGSQLTAEEIPVVEAFANHITIALENADLISALEASKARQRLLFDRASDGIFVFDDDAQIIDVNHGGCRMLGFDREELLGKGYADLISPQSLAKEPLRLDRLFSDKAVVIERQLQHKDGSQVAVEISAKRLPGSGMQAVIRDITVRTHSEKVLQRREKIMGAIAFAASQFLRLPSWEEGINDVLSLLGKAADVSRVYIFKNHPGLDGELHTTQLFEWAAPNIPSQQDNPALHGLAYQSDGFGRWEEILSRGENVHGYVDGFPESEQEILCPQGILSILAVPIYSRKNWWGFIGFDECHSLRDWGTSEIDALQAAAGTIGAAIERQRINEQERQRRQEAEMLMEVTTALTSTLNIDQLLNSILFHLQQVVPFISACIFLIHDNMVEAVAGYHLPDDNAILGQFLPVGDDLFITQMRRTRQPVILEDAQKEANFKTWGDTGYVRGWMGVPLLVRERVIGYVTLDNDKVAAYGEKEARLAQAFVNQAAVAIENAQLFAETQRLLRQTGEQTQQLQQIMNIVPDGILLLDTQRRVVSVNQAGETYLNSVGEILEDGRLTRVGQYTLEELYHPIPTPPPWKELESRDGNYIFEAAVWPLDRSREKDYWVLVLQDVTEERANHSYQQTQERLAIVGQMAAGIAHDFNNIMAVIVLYTQMLLKMPDLPPKEEKRLMTIFQQSRRASELIHQILDFSRQSLLERRPLSLQPFLQELTHLLKRTLPESIEIILEQQDGPLLVNADPGRIQQVVMNLALNARDAMPDGGVLKLCLKELILTEEEEKPLPDMTAGSWLRLQISDNGEGVSAEDLPHIFEPFFTTKQVGQGSGLGLAQVYGIVKQHEGFIDVESSPGEFTTFTIYLPAFKPAVKSLPESIPGLPRRGGGETILVVEDDENTRMAVVEILDMLNYKTLAAANGAAALALYKDNASQIDLVLSDVVMPVMDGAALHLALRDIQPDVKMIMMTGYPLEQSGKTFLKQNVVAWMQKPLHTEQIARTIHQALHGSND